MLSTVIGVPDYVVFDRITAAVSPTKPRAPLGKQPGELLLDVGGSRAGSLLLVVGCPRTHIRRADEVDTPAVAAHSWEKGRGEGECHRAAKNLIARGPTFPRERNDGDGGGRGGGGGAGSTGSCG